MKLLRCEYLLIFFIYIKLNIFGFLTITLGFWEIVIWQFMDQSYLIDSLSLN